MCPYAITVMGGGGHYHYPQHVWTPAGGWWPSPANWKRNTAIAFGALAFAVGNITMLSWKLEVRWG